MLCPKCQKEIADTVVECPHCHVVVLKFKKRQKDIKDGTAKIAPLPEENKGTNPILLILLAICIAGAVYTYWPKGAEKTHEPVATAPQPAKEVDINQLLPEAQGQAASQQSTEQALEHIDKLVGAVPGGKFRQQMVEQMDKPPEE